MVAEITLANLVPPSPAWMNRRQRWQPSSTAGLACNSSAGPHYNSSASPGPGGAHPTVHELARPAGALHLDGPRVLVLFALAGVKALQRRRGEGQEGTGVSAPHRQAGRHIGRGASRRGRLAECCGHRAEAADVSKDDDGINPPACAEGWLAEGKQPSHCGTSSDFLPVMRHSNLPWQPSSQHSQRECPSAASS